MKWFWLFGCRFVSFLFAVIVVSPFYLRGMTVTLWDNIGMLRHAWQYHIMRGWAVCWVHPSFDNHPSLEGQPQVAVGYKASNSSPLAGWLRDLLGDLCGGLLFSPSLGDVRFLAGSAFQMLFSGCTRQRSYSFHGCRGNGKCSWLLISLYWQAEIPVLYGMPV